MHHREHTFVFFVSFVVDNPTRGSVGNHVGYKTTKHFNETLIFVAATLP